MNKRKQISIVLTIIYLAVIAYITLLSRTPAFSQQAAPYPFWSYIQVLQGKWKIGLQIVENILLFIPLGFVLKYTGIKRKRIVVLTGLLVSAAIELSQLLFHLGLFEFDDILHNTLGCYIGAVLYASIKLSDAKKLVLSVLVVICSVIFCFTIQNPKANSASEFFFEVETIECVDEHVILTGYCFRYEELEAEYGLLLKSDREIVEVASEIQLSSDAINSYYKCEKDYSNTGFKAIADLHPSDTYEILVKWSNGITMSTGTYIRNNQVIYSSNPAPDFDGTLLVARPEYDFYVYQKGGELYWLCGDRFPFEDDGSTYIQYQLWTTQIDNLPEKRLANEWFWDNIGFVFEGNEIESWNEYHVAKRAIPSEYSITSIVTGYYKDGKWIWKDYFRPIVIDLPWFP